jgi:hypothetical protein
LIQDRGVRALRSLVAATLLLSLIACKAETERDFAGCEVEGMKIYPDHTGQYWSQYRDFLSACMRARGYENKGFCSIYPVCYSPLGIIARFFDNLEVKVSTPRG